MTPESVRGDSAYVVHLPLFPTDIESFARDENYFLQLLSQNFFRGYFRTSFRTMYYLSVEKNIQFLSRDEKISSRFPAYRYISLSIT